MNETHFHIFLHLFVKILFAGAIQANPLLSSWYTEKSGQYARIYETLSDEQNNIGSITWSRGQGNQPFPTYAGIHEISETADSVYVRTTGLGSHIMGPWYLNIGNTNLFPNYPSNQATIYRLPKNPGPVPTTKTETSLGRIGLFVDGVSMFDSRDGLIYNTSTGQDIRPTPGSGIPQIWNRDAYVNEGITFDAANAHSAGSNYHYHANPPALRYLLGDSVIYQESSNTYSEQFNGKHSPILGWVRDGYPVYGPYAYSDPMDSTSQIVRMRSGFRKRVITQRQTLPAYAARIQGFTNAGNTNEFALAPTQYGPDVVNEFIVGRYVEDYEYLGDVGQSLGIDFDLDEHNGRFCITPDFPQGTYAYFVAIDSNGIPIFPYNIGLTYYGTPTGNTVAALPTSTQVKRIFEGGPEKKLIAETIDTTLNEVTVTWSAVEGGTYVIEESSDLDQWDTSSGTHERDLLSLNKTRTDTKEFYRAELLDIDAFDSQGFAIDNTVSPSGNNILLIIVDDWGIDSSPLDNPSVSNAPMNTLQTLTAQGLRFTNAYAQPTCSATRANIITGRYSFRHGIGSPGGANLPVAEFTLPDAFAAANSNYNLISIGKWHLGGGDNGPEDRAGWTDFRGTLNASVTSYTSWDKTINGVTTTGVTTYTTTDQVNDAITFINAQGNNPWFCWLAFNAPHAPFDEPPPNLLPSNPTGTDQRSLYKKLLEALDTELANLMAEVDLNTTNVFIIGDNGTPSSVVEAPFSAGRAKGTLYEGGVRVPFLALGPDIRAQGVCDEPVHCSDLYSTILDLVGIEQTSVIPNDTEIDGRSLFPILNGSGTRDGCIVVENFGGNTANPGRAIRSGDYKLILYDNGNEEMYNVSTNIEETQELIAAGLNSSEQAAYDLIKLKNDELNNQQVIPPGILSLTPNTTSSGQTTTITFNLDPTASPSVPGLNQSVQSVTLGGISGTAVSRPSRYVVQATFDFLLSPGMYDALITYTGPQMRQFGLEDAIEITP